MSSFKAKFPASACILYRDGGRYQTFTDFYINLPEFVGMLKKTYEDRYLCMDPNGNLTILEGYAWDGPSGPAIATPAFMRPSLVHDALYDLLRDQVFDTKTQAYWREQADQVLFRLGKEDGMWTARCWWTYLGVRLGGGLAMRKKEDVFVAPDVDRCRRV